MRNNQQSENLFAHITHTQWQKEKHGQKEYKEGREKKCEKLEEKTEQTVKQIKKEGEKHLLITR